MVVDVLCRASAQGGAESQMNTATTLTTDHDRTIIAHKNEAVALQGNIIDRDAGMNGAGVGEDVSFTLNTVDRHGVAYDTGCLTPGEAQEQRCYSADAPAPTLQSRECGGGQGKSFVQKAGENVQPKYIVRRLMPVECGRLQGFPDGWGEIEQLPPDMPEETAAFWRRVYETDCAIKGKKPQKSILEKQDKLAAWHNGLHTDSAEYKMWGNGKGPLVQNDLSATLATHQDQTVFAPARDKCLPVNMMLATRCKALGRGTGLGVGDVGEPQYTITAGHEHAVAYENGTEPAAQTLTARADGSQMLDEGEAEDGQ